MAVRPPERPLYLHDWSQGPGGWGSKFGPRDPVRIVADPGAPAARVQCLARPTTGGHYFSPSIPLTNARAYCLDVALRWAGGGWPMVGVDLYGPGQVFLGEQWLVGRPGQRTESGDEVAAVPRDASGWRTYRKAFVVPPEATAVRLKDQLLETARRPGPDLAFVGPLALHLGRCEPAPAESPSAPSPLRRFLGLDP